MNALKSNAALIPENGISSDKDSKEIFSLEDSSLPRYSSENLQKCSSNLKSDNKSDITINIPKLMYQLLNAKVVIERMCENSRTNEQSTNKRTALNKSRLRNLVQRYCPMCQTLSVDAHNVSVKKSCLKCKSTLVYLCFKCNSKQYLSYQKFKAHWNTCRTTGFASKDLNQSDFLVKKNEIVLSKEVIRYCSRCNKVDANCSRSTDKKCFNCDQYLLYQCNKCKAQYPRYGALSYHMQSRCYSSLYKCNQCDLTNQVWENMRQHVISVHLGIRSNIETPTQDILADDMDCTKQISKEKYEDDSFLNRSQFILKKFESVSSTEKWTRYCPKCGIESVSNNIRRCTCNETLFYMCKKCNVKRYSNKSMAYHSTSRCFPTHQYKCTNCKYSTTLWQCMQLHFRIMHTSLPTMKCEFCSYKTKLKGCLTAHTRRMHGEISNLFHCNSCPYSTKFETNLQRHKKLNH